MPRQVAFLRAINVGGRTVTMSRLVELFEALELADISTVIASGNVLFTSRSRPALLEKQIDRHLEAELGYRAEAFVRTVPELAAILVHQPFTAREVDGSHALMIGFLRSAPTAAVVKAVQALGGPLDKLRFDDRQLYWLRTARESDPKLAGALEKTLGQPMTVRNINTLRRIVEREK
ncbi:MAG TPA: DUF1697 domain-containing protein [Gemmatimonadales bacterium]|nr:DUF1697 domain-containing protein [Gemmatimonadales bacterium]